MEKNKYYSVVLLSWLLIVFKTVSGQQFELASKCASLSGFTLKCKLGVAVTSLVQLEDPSKTTIGGCTSPPSPTCASAVGNIVSQDTAAGIITLEVIQANVDATNSVGNWTCIHGGTQFIAEISKIYDILNETLRITATKKTITKWKLSSSITEENITYSWSLDGASVGTGTTYVADICDVYTLTMSGGRAECLSTGLSNTATYKVKFFDFIKLVICLCLAIGLYTVVVGLAILCISLKKNTSFSDELKRRCAGQMCCIRFVWHILVLGIAAVAVFGTVIGCIEAEFCCTIGASVGSGIGIGVLGAVLVLAIILFWSRNAGIRDADPTLKIDGNVDDFHHKKIITGKPVTLPAVKFSGTAPFSVKWHFKSEKVFENSTAIHYSDTSVNKEREIEDLNRFTIKTTDKSTSLTIVNAQENDTGKYYAVVENSAGQGVAEIKIHIGRDTGAQVEPKEETENVESEESLLRNVPYGRRLPPIERDKNNQVV